MRRFEGSGTPLPSACESTERRVPHVRYGPHDAARHRAPVVLLLDWLSIVLAAAGLILMLAARAHYAHWPLLGLFLPALRFSLFGSYRKRLMCAFRNQAAAVQSFSEGSGAVPWRAATLLVVLPVFLFNLSNGVLVGSVDTRPVIPTAVSLVREGNWDVSEFARPGPGSSIRDRSGQVPLSFQVRGDRIYSAFPSGMVVFAVPVVSLSRLCGADLDQRLVQLRLEKITAALVGALCLGLFFLMACCVGPAQAAGATTFLLAVSSSLYTTVGLGLWQHGGVVFWSLIVLLVEFVAAGRPTKAGSAIQGLACAALLTCRPTATLQVAGLGLWIFLRSPRRAIFTMAWAVVAFLPCIAVYESLYGNLFGPLTIPLSMTGERWSFGRIDRLFGVFACPGRGLLVYQPWTVLLLLLLVPTVRRQARENGGRRRPSGWMAYCLIVPALHSVIVAAWFDWSGGYCWGSRLLTDIIPLLGLLCVPAIAWLWQSRRSRTVLLAIAILGAMAHIPCAYMGAANWNYVTDHEKDLWSWSNPPFLYVRSR